MSMARLLFFLLLLYKLEGVDGLLKEEGMPTFLFEHEVPGFMDLVGLVFTSREGKAYFSEKEQDLS